MKNFSVLCLVPMLIGATQAFAKDENRSSVVKIHVTQRLPNLLRPWTKASPIKTAGSGVVIDGKRILTNAHVVLYTSQIFVQADQSTDKIPASVAAVAPDVDLAVLQLEDGKFFDGRRALPLAEGIPGTKDTVNVYGYPVGGEQLSVTEGIVSRIEMAPFYYGTAGLRIQVDAALNPGNSGGPAIAKGQIVGLVFSKMRTAESIGYLVSAEEIAMFLKDVEDGTYHGKLKMFDGLQTTENEALREKLGLEKDAGGVMVTRPYIDDESYPLREWDVITHIGQHHVDSQGKARVKDDLRIAFPYFIPKVADNGAIPLTVFRDKKVLEVELPISAETSLLMPFLKGKYPRHFICGPMVFTSATQDLVAQLGIVPQAYLRSLDSPLLIRRGDRPAFDGEELVVLGPRLFPHRISKGYGSVTCGVVSHVNQTPVRNLSHLVETLRDASGRYVTFKIAGKYETLVFRRKEFLDSTEEILDNEGIRKQYSDDLREIWEKTK